MSLILKDSCNTLVMCLYIEAEFICVSVCNRLAKYFSELSKKTCSKNISEI